MKRFYVRKYLDSKSVNVLNMCELYLKESLNSPTKSGMSEERHATYASCKRPRWVALRFYLNNSLKNIQHSTAKV